MKTWKSYNIDLPNPRNETREFPKGKAEKACGICHSVNYGKSWHHPSPALKSEKLISAICPACKMIKNKQYEAEIIVKNVPEKIKTELINLTKSFCKRGFEKDPLDRLIEIRKINGDFRITTTENQLGAKLAKKIKEVFKPADLKISYSPAPSDVAYITINFRNK